MSNITKKTLAQALKDLTKNSPLDKITVKEIAHQSGVNRQTFYYHFRDIYQLIEWIFTIEAVESLEHHKSYETWQEGFLIVFNYVGNNLEFCENCFNSSGKVYLDRFLYKTTFELLIDVIDEIAHQKNIPDQERKFIADFYCHAFIGIITQWIRGGAKEDPKKIIHDINQLIEGDIHKSIRKYV